VHRCSVDCQGRWQSGCIISWKTWRRLVLWKGNTLTSKALAVQSIPEVTEKRAKWCPSFWPFPTF
jgi:hypothetical protein